MGGDKMLKVTVYNLSLLANMITQHSFSPVSNGICMKQSKVKHSKALYNKLKPTKLKEKTTQIEIN